MVPVAMSYAVSIDVLAEPYALRRLPNRVTGGYRVHMALGHGL